MDLHQRRKLIEIVRQQFHDGTDREHGARDAVVRNLDYRRILG